MGNVTSGENNDDLVDILKMLGYIKTKKVERIFRAVDRGDYVLASHRNEAYKDLSWKIGNIHLSAPCIYSKVMEGLSLEPGLSFLNIGSGTGYLSTMAGLILNRHGTNHGIELNSDCMAYAYKKLEEFKQKSLALDEFDFCEPVFMQGNCLKLECTRKYDRVYCGAACPESHEAFIKQFVKVGGILVMPYKDHLLRIERVDTDNWKHRVMLPVLFAPLILPLCSSNNSRDHRDNNNEDKTNGDNLIDCHNSSLLLPFSEPLSLQELCRCEIRHQLRKNIWSEHPELETKHPITGINKTTSDALSSNSQSTFQRCIVPLYDQSSGNSHYITLNDDYDDDDDDEDDEDEDEDHNNDSEDNNDDDVDVDEYNNDDNDGDDDVNNKDRSSKICRRQNRRTRLFFCLEPPRLENELNEEEEQEQEEYQDQSDDNDDGDDEIEQVTSFQVLKNVSPAKSMLNFFKLNNKSSDDNDDNNKIKVQGLSGNAFQPSTSQYLSQGCSNNDNIQQISHDVLFTSAKESLDSLICNSNSQINNDNQASEEIMEVDKEHQKLCDDNFQVAHGTGSSEQNSSTSTNNIENEITNTDNSETTSNTAYNEEVLDDSNDIDNDDDDSMEWLNSIKPRHQQRSNKWGIPDYLNSTESHPSLSKRSKVNNNDNNNDNSREHRQQPRVFAYYVNIASLSTHMKTKISQLPLPVSLRLYINYNRSL